MFAATIESGSSLRNAIVAAGYTLEETKKKTSNLNDLPERDRALARIILRAKNPEAAFGLRIRRMDIEEPTKFSAVLHKIGATLYGIRGQREFVTIGRAKHRKSA